MNSIETASLMGDQRYMASKKFPCSQEQFNNIRFVVNTKHCSSSSKAVSAKDITKSHAITKKNHGKIVCRF